MLICGEIRTLVYGGNLNGTVARENSMKVLNKLKIKLPYDQAVFWVYIQRN